MKRVAIIGCNSMLGMALTDKLLLSGVEVIRIGRSKNADIYMDFEKDDVSDFDTTVQVDTVFHCASSFADDSLKGVSVNFKVNTASALKIIKLVECLGVKNFIYAGTISSDVLLEYNKYTSYGLTKSLAEQLLQWYFKSHGNFSSLRFSQLYDFEGKCIKHQPWFGRIIAYSSKGLDINLPPSEGVRNFLCVEDAAELMIASAKKQLKGIFNVVHPKSYTYEEIAKISYSIFGKGGNIVVKKEKEPFRPISFVYDNTIYSMLKKDPLYDIEKGLNEIFRKGTASSFGPMDVK